MDQKIVLITGSSRGIGKATAVAFSKRHHKVYASMRNPEKCDFANDLIIPIPLNVVGRDTIKTCVDEIIQKEGRIDVVVNNAGYGLFSPIELAPEEEVVKQFDVNVFGTIRVIQEVLPHMRKEKKGHIINISSIAGVVSHPLLGFYAATKHAIEAISESLALNLLPWNIHVSIVEPGATATAFSDNIIEPADFNKDNPYDPLYTHYRTSLERRIAEGQDPKEIGRLIAAIAEEESPLLRYQTNDRIKNIVSQFIHDVTGMDQIKAYQDELSEIWKKR